METILQILQWAIPSGGIGAAISWFVNRKVNQAKSKKEIHDTFKKMYEDVSDLLLKIQNENEELHATVNDLLEKDALTRRALNRLSRAIEAIPLCEYHAQCPVLGELRLDEGGGTGTDEASGGNGRADRGEPGTDQPGGDADKRKPHAGTSGQRHRQSPRGGGVQLSGGKYPRVSQEAEGRLGKDPGDKPESHETQD